MNLLSLKEIFLVLSLFEGVLKLIYYTRKLRLISQHWVRVRLNTTTSKLLFLFRLLEINSEKE